jgi:hypothetical protein
MEQPCGAIKEEKGIQVRKNYLYNKKISYNNFLINIDLG